MSEGPFLVEPIPIPRDCSPELLHMLKLLNLLLCDEKTRWYREPVNLSYFNNREDEWEAYKAKIHPSTPIDLSTIRALVLRGMNTMNLSDLQQSVARVFQNAMKFNAPETPWHDHARRLESVWTRLTARLKLQRSGLFILEMDPAKRQRFAQCPTHLYPCPLASRKAACPKCKKSGQVYDCVGCGLLCENCATPLCVRCDKRNYSSAQRSNSWDEYNPVPFHRPSACAYSRKTSAVSSGRPPKRPRTPATQPPRVNAPKRRESVGASKRTSPPKKSKTKRKETQKTGGKSSAPLASFSQISRLPVDDSVTRTLLAVIRAIREQQVSAGDPFLPPVTEAIAPDYFDYIKRDDARCISDIKAKLDLGSYKRVAEFVTDVDLMINNALLYNNEGDPIHMLAKRLRQSFDEIQKARMIKKLSSKVKKAKRKRSPPQSTTRGESGSSKQVRTEEKRGKSKKKKTKADSKSKKTRTKKTSTKRTKGSGSPVRTRATISDPSSSSTPAKPSIRPGSPTTLSPVRRRKPKRSVLASESSSSDDDDKDDTVMATVNRNKDDMDVDPDPTAVHAEIWDSTKITRKRPLENPEERPAKRRRREVETDVGTRRISTKTPPKVGRAGSPRTSSGRRSGKRTRTDGDVNPRGKRARVDQENSFSGAESVASSIGPRSFNSSTVPVKKERGSDPRLVLDGGDRTAEDLDGFYEVFDECPSRSNSPIPFAIPFDKPLQNHAASSDSSDDDLEVLDVPRTPSPPPLPKPKVVDPPKQYLPPVEDDSKDLSDHDFETKSSVMDDLLSLDPEPEPEREPVRQNLPVPSSRTPPKSERPKQLPPPTDPVPPKRVAVEPQDVEMKAPSEEKDAHRPIQPHEWTGILKQINKNVQKKVVRLVVDLDDDVDVVDVTSFFKDMADYAPQHPVQDSVDLDKIKSKLSTDYYRSVHDFMDDYRRIWERVLFVEEENSQHYKWALTMREVFENEVKQILPQHYESAFCPLKCIKVFRSDRDVYTHQKLSHAEFAARIVDEEKRKQYLIEHGLRESSGSVNASKDFCSPPKPPRQPSPPVTHATTREPTPEPTPPPPRPATPPKLVVETPHVESSTKTTRSAEFVRKAPPSPPARSFGGSSDSDSDSEGDVIMRTPAKESKVKNRVSARKPTPVSPKHDETLRQPDRPSSPLETRRHVSPAPSEDGSLNNCFGSPTPQPQLSVHHSPKTLVQPRVQTSLGVSSDSDSGEGSDSDSSDSDVPVVSSTVAEPTVSPAKKEKKKSLPPPVRGRRTAPVSARKSGKTLNRERSRSKSAGSSVISHGSNMSGASRASTRSQKSARSVPSSVKSKTRKPVRSTAAPADVPVAPSRIGHVRKPRSRAAKSAKKGAAKVRGRKGAATRVSSASKTKTSFARKKAGKSSTKSAMKIPSRRRNSKSSTSPKHSKASTEMSRPQSPPQTSSRPSRPAAVSISPNSSPVTLKSHLVKSPKQLVEEPQTPVLAPVEPPTETQSQIPEPAPVKSPPRTSTPPASPPRTTSPPQEPEPPATLPEECKDDVVPKQAPAVSLESDEGADKMAENLTCVLDAPSSALLDSPLIVPSPSPQPSISSLGPMMLDDSFGVVGDDLAVLATALPICPTGKDYSSSPPPPPPPPPLAITTLADEPLEEPLIESPLVIHKKAPVTESVNESNAIDQEEKVEVEDEQVEASVDSMEPATSSSPLTSIRIRKKPETKEDKNNSPPPPPPPQKSRPVVRKSTAVRAREPKHVFRDEIARSPVVAPSRVAPSRVAPSRVASRVAPSRVAPSRVPTRIAPSRVSKPKPVEELPPPPVSDVLPMDVDEGDGNLSRENTTRVHVAPPERATVITAEDEKEEKEMEIDVEPDELSHISFGMYTRYQIVRNNCRTVLREMKKHKYESLLAKNHFLVDLDKEKKAKQMGRIMSLLNREFYANLPHDFELDMQNLFVTAHQAAPPGSAERVYASICLDLFQLYFNVFVKSKMLKRDDPVDPVEYPVDVIWEKVLLPLKNEDVSGFLFTPFDPLEPIRVGEQEFYNKQLFKQHFEQHQSESLHHVEWKHLGRLYESANQFYEHTRSVLANFHRLAKELGAKAVFALKLPELEARFEERWGDVEKIRAKRRISPPDFSFILNPTNVEEVQVVQPLKREEPVGKHPIAGDMNNAKNFTLKQIVDEKLEGELGQQLFLCAWEGFEDEHNTWEPLCNLARSKNAQSLITQWNTSNTRHGFEMKRPAQSELYDSNGCPTRAAFFNEAAQYIPRTSDLNAPPRTISMLARASMRAIAARRRKEYLVPGIQQLEEERLKQVALQQAREKEERQLLENHVAAVQVAVSRPNLSEKRLPIRLDLQNAPTRRNRRSLLGA